LPATYQYPVRSEIAIPSPALHGSCIQSLSNGTTTEHIERDDGPHGGAASSDAVPAIDVEEFDDD
jgi:hypothetical protein